MGCGVFSRGWGRRAAPGCAKHRGGARQPTPGISGGRSLERLLPAQGERPVGLELGSVQAPVDRNVPLGGDAVALQRPAREVEVQAQGDVDPLAAAEIIPDGGGHHPVAVDRIQAGVVPPAVEQYPPRETEPAGRPHREPARAFDDGPALVTPAVPVQPEGPRPLQAPRGPLAHSAGGVHDAGHVHRHGHVERGHHEVPEHVGRLEPPGPVPVARDGHPHEAVREHPLTPLVGVLSHDFNVLFPKRISLQGNKQPARGRMTVRTWANLKQTVNGPARAPGPARSGDGRGRR